MTHPSDQPEPATTPFPAPPPVSGGPTSGYEPPTVYAPPAGYAPPAPYAPPAGYAPPPGYGQPVAGYGPPMAPERKPGTNPFAIVSLILSICGGTLLAIIFGIVALVQIRKSGQSGKGLAIAGLAISGTWILVIVVGVVVALATEAERGAGGGISEAGSISIENARAGDCLVSVPELSTERVDAVPCGEPHKAEVFATFPLSGSSYPGDSIVETKSEDGCYERLDTYLSPTVDEASVSLVYFAPNRQSWATGDKTVICIAEMSTTQTASIRR